MKIGASCFIEFKLSRQSAIGRLMLLATVAHTEPAAQGCSPLKGSIAETYAFDRADLDAIPDLPPGVLLP